jgi:hypothetical protein
LALNDIEDAPLFRMPVAVSALGRAVAIWSRREQVSPGQGQLAAVDPDDGAVLRL